MKNVRVIDTSDPSRVKPQISHPLAIKWMKAEVHVFADSVLCLGKIKELADAIERWTGQLKDLNSTVSIQEIYGIDVAPTEFEWNTFPGLIS